MLVRKSCCKLVYSYVAEVWLISLLFKYVINPYFTFKFLIFYITAKGILSPPFITNKTENRNFPKIFTGCGVIEPETYVHT